MDGVIHMAVGGHYRRGCACVPPGWKRAPSHCAENSPGPTATSDQSAIVPRQPTRDLQGFLRVFCSAAPPFAMALPPIPARCYPCYHACHVAYVPGTAHVEGLGLAVIGAAPAGIGPLLPAFVTAVCHWGGGHGHHIAPTVLNPANNPQQTIVGCFNASIASLAAANLVNALNSLTGLHGLGISFASKHLRMLRPDLCGVFDGLVAGAGLGYALSPPDLPLIPRIAPHKQTCSMPRELSPATAAIGMREQSTWRCLHGL